MLKEILDEFRQTATPLCVTELSQKLDIDSSALEGMLQTLVRSGRLLEIDPNDQSCVACPAKGGCIILTNGLQKSYVSMTPTQSFQQTIETRAQLEKKEKIVPRPNLLGYRNLTDSAPEDQLTPGGLAG